MSEPPITIRSAHDSGPQDRIDCWVIHDEEYPVRSGSAADIANYFTSQASGGSVTYVVDANDEQHCVPDMIISWQAPPNYRTAGIEQDGYARFVRSDWLTDGSKRTIGRACARGAEMMVRHNLPVVRLHPNDLLNGNRGYCGHNDRSAAWGQSTHTDPGSQYPWDIVDPLLKEGVRRLANDAAVRAFQTERKLTVDGDPGIRTVMALGAYLYEHWMSPVPQPVPIPSGNRFAPMAVIALGAHDAAEGPHGKVILDYTRPVQSLQSAINVCDKKDTTGLTLDGDFGPGTLAAVKRYQGYFFRGDKDGGKRATDGVCGPRTWQLLDWILDGIKR